jgi:hypothetical protein
MIDDTIEVSPYVKVFFYLEAINLRYREGAVGVSGMAD